VGCRIPAQFLPSHFIEHNTNIKTIPGNGNLSLISRYWTALSRRGCVGQIRNCFLENNLDESKNEKFWQNVHIESEGSCIFLQKCSDALLSIFGTMLPKLTPYFAPCEHLANLGCETAGSLATVIDSYQDSPKHVRKCAYLFL
jgi:hypothetical protein